MTISSIEALPARSPIPLIAPSTCRAPASTADRLLATAIPRSSWQWAEKMTPGNAGRTRAIRALKISPISPGVLYPTVSGIFRVPAPADAATSQTSARKAGSVRIASSGLNSMSSNRVAA